MSIAEWMLVVGMGFICTPWIHDNDARQIAHVGLGLLLLFIVVY